MIELSSEYQYLGRSNAIRPYGTYSTPPSDPAYDDIPKPPVWNDPGYRYYILIYGKTVPDAENGRHRVTVKMRLACTGNASFYGFNTTASATVKETNVFAWDHKSVPSAYWGNSSTLTEDGNTYRRWVDLKEGAVEVDTGYEESEIDICASWRRNSISADPPSWLPSTDTATFSTLVLLSSIEPPEQPEPEQPAGPTSYIGTRVYADDALVYDSRDEDLDLVALKATTGLNIGGTAEITMPAGHPAYNYFVWYRTVVTILRGDAVRFRGRALYPENDAAQQRKIVCEGELCFLRDGCNRPGSRKGTPAQVFRALIGDYNAQVEAFKQFEIGSVTVSGKAVELTNENGEPILTTVKKLIDLCGGYIVFTSNSSGKRVIHYLQKINRRSNQTIEFGENLLDVSSTGANNDSLATGLVPYGAKDEATGKRISIDSVNDGKDYIIAEDAKAIRGTIMASAVFESARTPSALMDMAWDWLNGKKSYITSLRLTALDLSYLNKSVAGFEPGDIIEVIAAPYAVNDLFQLIQMTEDFLKPINGDISLGKDVQSLTGAAAADSFSMQSALDSTVAALRNSYATEASYMTAGSHPEQNSAELLPDAYVAMLDKLTPLRFRYDGEGELFHVGFSAQDVAQAVYDVGLSLNDFAGLVDVSGDGSQLNVAYEEFIGILLQKIINLESRINALEEKA